MKNTDKPLIDTNVCLDLLLKRIPFVKEAGAIFQQSEQGTIDGVISAISFDTLAYIMRTDFTAKEAAEKLKNLASITTVGTANKSVIIPALSAGWKDIEDAIQYHCARENACNAIITRNTEDFSKSALPVFTPLEFLDQHKSDKEE